MPTAIYSTILKRLQEERNKNVLLVESFQRLGQSDRALDIDQCGTYIEVSHYADGDNRITAANFCRQRMCCVCNYRRALRLYSTTSQVLDEIDRRGHDIRYLFLTLTVRNVDGECLGDTLDAMQAAWKRLVNNRAVKRRIRGAIRTLEVTVNARTGQFHPHYHVILAVSPRYFEDVRSYWAASSWGEAWRSAARLDYQPIVDIRAIKPRPGSGLPELGAVKEVSKYAVKPGDYLVPDKLETDRRVWFLSSALRGRRLIGYTGIFGKVAREIRAVLPDESPAGLLDGLRPDISCVVYRFKWGIGPTGSAGYQIWEG